MNDKISIWLCIIFCTITFILGCIGGYITKNILYDRERTDNINREAEKGRRIINCQRETIKRLGEGIASSFNYYRFQQQGYRKLEKNYKELKEKQLQSIKKISDSIIDVEEAALFTDKSRNEIQQALHILEEIKNRE